MDKKILLRVKSTKSQIKAINDEEGIVEAYVSVFGNVDMANEIVMQGAFAESLKKKLPKGVWAHNWDQPIAKTLEAREDAHGLYIKAQLILDVEKGREAYALMKAGVIDEFSIGYSVDDYEVRPDGIVELKQLTLFEWSPVLVGANRETELLGVKGMKDMTEIEVPAEEQQEAPAEEEPQEAAKQEEAEAPQEEAQQEPAAEDLQQASETEEEKGLKAGRVLSAKNRALIEQVVMDAETFTKSLNNLVTPLKQLLDAADEGGKVAPTANISREKIYRVRHSAKEASRHLNYLLRISKQ